jgi:hypothetical protein
MRGVQRLHMQLKQLRFSLIFKIIK